MTITIQRSFTKGEITEGHVTIDGQRICDTLENSFSLLAPGTYEIELVKCKQYARKMIIVKTDNSPLTTNLSPLTPHPSPLPGCPDCPRQRLVYSNTKLPRVCPQLKPGNGIHNRHDGSILVGTRGSLGCILHPREAFNTIFERIRKNVERGREVTLEIRSKTTLCD